MLAATVKHLAKSHVRTMSTMSSLPSTIQCLDYLIVDQSGVIRSKRVPLSHTSQDEKLLENGVRIPGSVMSMDVCGEIVYGTGLIFEEGEKDRFCKPIPSTLSVTPWKAKPTCASVLTTMFDDDGTPFFADPRQVMMKMVKKFSELGLSPVMAVELEFYLCDQDRTDDRMIQPASSLLNGRKPATTQVYADDRVSDFEELLYDIHDACRQQGISTECLVAESGPGQYEINLDHGDIEKVADSAILYKRTVKGVASKYGIDSTFMAKPYGNKSGNGLHIHVSLVDESGRNVFSQDDASPSPVFHQALAGLCASMPEAMAIFCPNVNSYRRLKEDGNNFLPITPNWGFNNRTTALRIPPGPPSALRIEHRLAGADANIYLVIASILAGMHHGISNKLTPPPPIEGNAYLSDQATLPLTWKEAVDTMSKGCILPTYFGQDYCDLYTALRTGERLKFKQNVTPLEYDWYLSNV